MHRWRKSNLLPLVQFLKMESSAWNWDIATCEILDHGMRFEMKCGSFTGKFMHYYRASSYASTVLAVVILSARLSHACFVTKPNNVLWIFWYHTKGQSLWFSDTNSGWWATPPFIWRLRSNWPTPFKKCRLQQISAYNISTVTDSEKKFYYDEYKVDHGLSNEL